MYSNNVSFFSNFRKDKIKIFLKVKNMDLHWVAMLFFTFLRPKVSLISKGSDVKRTLHCKQLQKTKERPNILIQGHTLKSQLVPWQNLVEKLVRPAFFIQKGMHSFLRNMFEVICIFLHSKKQDVQKVFSRYTPEMETTKLLCLPSWA